MAAVFARTRRYGILRLHGHSWLHHASRETLHAVSVAAIGMGATALISVPILGFYNGLAQWMRWFRWSIQIWILSVAVLLTVEIVTLAIAWSSAEILAQVKGRMTSLPVFSASYLLRFPVAMLAILLIVSVTSATRELWRYEDQQAQWATVDRHVGRVTLRGIGSAVIDAASEKRMVDAVGAWLSDVDEHHGLIVATLSPVDVGLPAPIQLFIINDEYCQRHPVPACASSPNASTVTGTVPASLSSVEPRIRHAIAQQLSASAKAGKATIKWSRQEGSHDYFTYGPQSPEQGLSATMTDPVVIRVPSGLLSGDDLTTALTTGGILLLDPNSESRRVTSSPSLARAVASISPAGASTAQKASQQRQQLLIAALGALASLLTVVATSVSITGMYSTVHRQRSLVRKLHGWSGLYMFRQVVAWETGLWGTLAIVIAWRSVTSWQAGRTESIAEGRRPHDLLSWAYTAPWAWAGTAGVGIATLSILSYAGSIEH